MKRTFATFIDSLVSKKNPQHVHFIHINLVGTVDTK
jgi:hypothetical protein